MLGISKTAGSGAASDYGKVLSFALGGDMRVCSRIIHCIHVSCTMYIFYDLQCLKE